jgi:hypothetical protein
MILKCVFLIDDDEGKREQNPTLYVHSWPPPPPPSTTSTKILHKIAFLWNLNNRDVVDTTFELNCLKFKHFKFAPF